MPYTAVAATVRVMYHCSFCGAEGEEEVEGDAYVGNVYGCIGFTCPKCGEELTDYEDLDALDDGNEGNEDEKEEKDE